MKSILSAVTQFSLLPSVLMICVSCVAPGRNPVSYRHGQHQVVVGVREQQLALLDGGRVERVYPVSTSKFGLGSRPNSYATPLGQMAIADKIGGNAPPGAVFKGRRLTGEIARPNTGRDPIITRIMPLVGMERQNANTAARRIYIHGTPAENNIGRPASYGCVRMRSADVMDLYSRVGIGTPVTITNYPWTNMVARNTLSMVR